MSPPRIPAVSKPVQIFTIPERKNHRKEDNRKYKTYKCKSQQSVKILTKTSNSRPFIFKWESHLQFTYYFIYGCVKSRDVLSVNFPKLHVIQNSLCTCKLPFNRLNCLRWMSIMWTIFIQLGFYAAILCELFSSALFHIVLFFFYFECALMRVIIVKAINLSIETLATSTSKLDLKSQFC